MHCFDEPAGEGQAETEAGAKWFTLDEVLRLRAHFAAEGSRAKEYRPFRPEGLPAKIAAIANFKGGVGKTSTAAHLAMSAALDGYRVLVIDLDSQGSMTSIFGGTVPDEWSTVFPLLARDYALSLREENRRRVERGDPPHPLDPLLDTALERTARDIIQKTHWPNIDLIGAQLNLYWAEFQIPVWRMAARGWRLMVEAAKYAVNRTGLLTLSAAHIQAYWRSRPGLAGPDVQYHILPATVDIPRFVEKQLWELERAPGLTIAPCQLRPESRGTIHVKSHNPFEAPAIRPNYLSDPIDQQTITEGLKFACTLASQEALKPYVVDRLTPPPGPMNDADWLGYAREMGSTIYHPVGTCRMGQASDPGAVVDPAGRVHGVAGLRVIDASVMPRLVSGNTNAPTIMIAEKMAAAVLADAREAAAAG